MNKTQHICKNCSQEYKGKFCNSCGEKRIEDKDFSITNIVQQAFGAITNLDSKFFQTMKLLFFYPGRLTLKNVEGVRVRYMKPFQIFIIANIFFFLFLSDTDIFRTPAKWFLFSKNTEVSITQQVDKILKEKKISKEELSIIYDNKSANYAKSMIVLLLPFMALISWLLNFKSHKQYGKHLIFATHYFSFVLLFMTSWALIVENFISNYNKFYFIIPFTFSMLVYYIFAQKNFFYNSWILSIVKGVVAVFFINFFISFYKFGINYLTLDLI